MSREERKAVFEDTEKLCKENEKLREALAYATANQELILEGDAYAVPKGHRYETPAKIVVSKKRTFAAASAYCDGQQKVAVHNFASATNPGGGVTKGSSAQEECLCRCSGLYLNLNVKEMWDGFYGPHRAMRNPIHNDDIIYTPKVTVFKSDTEEPKLMKETDWYQVDVITCAAPNLRPNPTNRMNPDDGDPTKLTDKELLQIQEKRMRRILDVAKAHQVDTIVLGAFGCGAFRNKPEVVAQAMKHVVEEYKYDFATIEFAVYCSPRDDCNYQIFDRMLG